MTDAGLVTVLVACLGMALASHLLPRHFAWLDRKQAEREAAAEKLMGDRS
jgi:hypothetical protein